LPAKSVPCPFGIYALKLIPIIHQDGKAAGQSIAHVHVHIIPRRFTGDRFEGVNDDIYPAIEQAEEDLPHQLRNKGIQESEKLKVDADEDRKPRTLGEMEREAQWLNSFF